MDREKEKALPEVAAARDIATGFNPCDHELQ